MKVFIFERIDKLTDNWHPEGGLVIIANDIEHAKEVISANSQIAVTEEEWAKVESFELANEAELKFWTMPDAGCC